MNYDSGESIERENPHLAGNIRDAPIYRQKIVIRRFGLFNASSESVQLCFYNHLLAEDRIGLFVTFSLGMRCLMQVNRVTLTLNLV